MPKQSTSKGATIQVRVSDVLKDDIELYARDRGMTVAEFVRYCVWTYMDSTPSDEGDEIDEYEMALWPTTPSARPHAFTVVRTPVEARPTDATNLDLVDHRAER